MLRDRVFCNGRLIRGVARRSSCVVNFGSILHKRGDLPCLLKRSDYHPRRNTSAGIRYPLRCHRKLSNNSGTRGNSASSLIYRRFLLRRDECPWIWRWQCRRGVSKQRAPRHVVRFLRRLVISRCSNRKLALPEAVATAVEGSRWSFIQPMKTSRNGQAWLTVHCRFTEGDRKTCCDYC